jgi:hypothetical protein
MTRRNIRGEPVYEAGEYVVAQPSGSPGFVVAVVERVSKCRTGYRCQPWLHSRNCWGPTALIPFGNVVGLSPGGPPQVERVARKLNALSNVRAMQVRRADREMQAAIKRLCGSEEAK